MKTEQLSAGITLSLEGKIYRVESSVRVNTKANSFIKVKLRAIVGDEIIEKNFKPGQTVEEVSLEEKVLEFLYPENNHYLFLDVATLDEVLVLSSVIGDKIDFLKEGVQVKATFYGETVFSLELPQFLELTVVRTEGALEGSGLGSNKKIAYLETGAKIPAPLFIEPGDLVKVDTTQIKENIYVQRV